MIIYLILKKENTMQINEAALQIFVALIESNKAIFKPNTEGYLRPEEVIEYYNELVKAIMK